MLMKFTIIADVRPMEGVTATEDPANGEVLFVAKDEPTRNTIVDAGTVAVFLANASRLTLPAGRLWFVNGLDVDDDF